MAPAADYLFLSIETLVNTISLFIMVPCLITLIRTQSMHGNCKVFLITSASVQLSILLVQAALFIHCFITENLHHIPEKQKPFEMAQNGLFVMSSCLSLALVLERMYAVRNAVEYERSGRHLIPLAFTISASFAMGCMGVYFIYWRRGNFEIALVVYGIEALTLFISIFIIVYAHRKYKGIPYGEDRLNAKYQVKEVWNFSLAILPSVILSVVMHTLSLVPVLLWIRGVITYPLCCLIYFLVHSLNCIVSKLTLIACHKCMLKRFKLIFVAKLRTPKSARIKRDTKKEGEQYFEQIRAAWEAGPTIYERDTRISKFSTI